MYSFVDFDTVQNLPDVLADKELAAAIGLSISRTHELLDEMRIPYVRLGKRKVIFKEHLLEGLSGKNIFTDVAKLKVIVNLPKVFAPCHLKGVFGISTGYSYTVVRLPDFPATYTRNCFVVNKQGLIEWIRKKEIYTRKE